MQRKEAGRASEGWHQTQPPRSRQPNQLTKRCALFRLPPIISPVPSLPARLRPRPATVSPAPAVASDLLFPAPDLHPERPARQQRQPNPSAIARARAYINPIPIALPTRLAPPPPAARLPRAPWSDPRRRARSVRLLLSSGSGVICRRPSRPERRCSISGARNGGLRPRHARTGARARVPRNSTPSSARPLVLFSLRWRQ
jgi:hypothetical protein